LPNSASPELRQSVAGSSWWMSYHCAVLQLTGGGCVCNGSTVGYPWCGWIRFLHLGFSHLLCHWRLLCTNSANCLCGQLILTMPLLHDRDCYA